MVHSKVKTMKFVLLLVAGLWLAACADERGFRAKTFPSTADQEQKKAGKNNGPCDASGQPITPPSSQTQPPSQQPVNPAQNIVDQNSATPSPSVGAAPVQHQDEVLDHTIHTIVEQLEPGSASAEVEAKFRNNLTAGDHAIQVIKGMDIGQLDANGNGVQIEIKTLINDDGGDDKTLIASGAVPYGTEKLTELKTNLQNAKVYAFFCSREACGDGPGLLRVYMMVSPAKGDPVVAIFMQSLINNGQNTIIKSSIVTPFPSYDSVYSAKKTMQTVITRRASDKSQHVSGDPNGGLKFPARAVITAKNVKKDQSRLEPDPNGEPEKINAKKSTEPEKKTADSGSSADSRKPEFRNVTVIHDNDNTQPQPTPAANPSAAKASPNGNSVTLPKVMKSVTADQAKKAMDDALKSKAVAPPSETLPSDVVSSSGQAKISPKSSDDVTKAWDEALKNTMKNLNKTQEVKAPATSKPATTPAPKAQPDQQQQQPQKQNSYGIIST